MADNERAYCDGCLPEYRVESAETFMLTGPRKLAQLMGEGRDPTHGGDAARKRGKSIGQWNREAAAWRATHEDGADPETFRREILPRLQDVPLRAMMRATGLSLRYCSFIRRGEKVPHPRHWDALRQPMVAG